ncbi:hypothetical protein [Flavobacterium aestivum]|uniref:hypothetical protein n=1 Tax=Flavobacterium aestivum TaxID=3003257 RepID=UPI002285C580|nr:hypothetical protein [Flavobacterium aestivum]
MNWIRKIIIFSGLLFLFTFAITANKSNSEQTKPEENNSTITAKGIHSSAFIVPRHGSTLIINHKSVDSPIIKWVTPFLITIPGFKKYNFHNTYLNQDINRCIKVSILLFPFHYFW